MADLEQLAQKLKMIRDKALWTSDKYRDVPVPEYWYTIAKEVQRMIIKARIEEICKFMDIEEDIPKLDRIKELEKELENLK